MRSQTETWEKRVGYVADAVAITILLTGYGVCWYVITSFIIRGFQRGEYVIAVGIMAFVLFIIASVASLAVHPVAKHWFR